MAEPVSHAVSLSKAAASASAFITILFDVPLGVFMAGFTGAWLGVLFGDPLPFLRGAGIILLGAVVAALLTPLVGELIRWQIEGANISVMLKGVALMIGFIPCHPPTRKWFINKLKAKGKEL